MTKEEYMAIREDKTDMLEEFVEWRNKNGEGCLQSRWDLTMTKEKDMTKVALTEDEPFMTVNVDYYESTNSDGERRIRVVTTTQKWVGSSKDPVASTTFEYL